MCLLRSAIKLLVPHGLRTFIRRIVDVLAFDGRFVFGSDDRICGDFALGKRSRGQRQYDTDG